MGNPTWDGALTVGVIELERRIGVAVPLPGGPTIHLTAAVAACMPALAAATVSAP